MIARVLRHAQIGIGQRDIGKIEISRPHVHPLNFRKHLRVGLRSCRIARELVKMFAPAVPVELIDDRLDNHSGLGQFDRCANAQRSPLEQGTIACTGEALHPQAECITHRDGDGMQVIRAPLCRSPP